jgi:putative ABC transport system substrate-binding protein
VTRLVWAPQAIQDVEAIRAHVARFTAIIESSTVYEPGSSRSRPCFMVHDSSDWTDRAAPARLAVTAVLALALLAAPLWAPAQEARVYRVGVLHLGGLYVAAVDGLRDGLKQLGLEEGRQVIFHVRDVRGDPKALPGAARGLESERVDVIYSILTSVTIEAKRATQRVPIVFHAGDDPVAVGLVESLRRPGGRLSGVYSQSTLLLAKRFELLKEMIPALRRVAFFYVPGTPQGQRNLNRARDAAVAFKLQLVERPVGSVEELRASLEALRPGEADAATYLDGMVVSQTAMVVDAARTKRLPIVVGNPVGVAQGALASYGLSPYTTGRLAAKHVQRVLLGTSPAELPVEMVDRLHLAINLKTAKALGLTIPPAVRVRADEVIE